ncbi:hypothetical protein ACFL96_11415 [Thermoproteota archaeon]
MADSSTLDKKFDKVVLVPVEFVFYEGQIPENPPGYVAESYSLNDPIMLCVEISDNTLCAKMSSKDAATINLIEKSRKQLKKKDDYIKYVKIHGKVVEMDQLGSYCILHPDERKQEGKPIGRAATEAPGQYRKVAKTPGQQKPSGQ